MQKVYNMGRLHSALVQIAMHIPMRVPEHEKIVARWAKAHTSKMDVATMASLIDRAWCHIDCHNAI